MDALQLLGSLLGNNATSSSTGNQILGQLVSSLSGGGQAGYGGQTGYGGQAGYGGQQSAVSSGIVAALGGLAMTALQQYMQRAPSGAAAGQSPLSALAGMFGGSSAGGQLPLAALAGTLGMGGTTAPDAAQAHQQALVLVQAMINAAKADGQIDAQEQQNITTRLSGLGPEEVGFVRQEIAKPLNLDFLTQVTPAMATEVYAVSLMAINLDTPTEVNYMQQLAQQLGLDAQTIQAIHQQLGIQSTPT